MFQSGFYTGISWQKGKGKNEPFIVTKDGAKGWPVVFELNFNANNGCGASGLFCGMSYGRAVNVRGRNSSYASILGEEDPKGWHQYRVVWKTSGVDPNGNIMQIWIDGKLAGSGMRGEKIAEDFRKGISGPVHLVFSNPQSGHGASPVCVDDFKMWSVAMRTNRVQGEESCSCHACVQCGKDT